MAAANTALPVREALAAMQRAVRAGEMEEARLIGASAAVPLNVGPADLEIGPELSRGAEAIVLRGRLAGRDVAVKRFTIARSEDLARFRAELALMSELSHPAICPVLAANALPPSYLLVMPLAAGTLHGRLHRQGWRPSWGELLSISVALADAVAAVHARGMVHRDIKSGNVLMSEDGRPALSDFGLAATAEQLAEASNVTSAALRSRGMPSGGFHKRLVQGTLEYMAPEVLIKRPASFASDIYALAVLINEAATGTYPFSDCTKDNPDIHTVLEHGYGRQELAAAVVAEGLRPMMPRGPAPPGFAELIEQCWALDPAARPSAPEVARRLAEIAAGVAAWEGERVRRSIDASRAEAAAIAAAAGASGARRSSGGSSSTSGDGSGYPMMGASPPLLTPVPSMPNLAGLDAILDSESGRSSWTAEDDTPSLRTPMEVSTEPDTPSGYGTPPRAAGPAMLSAQPLGRAPGAGASTTPSHLFNISALSRAAAVSEPPPGMQLLAGAFGAIGPRESMEDRQLIRGALGGDDAVQLVAVFDGHRGHEAAAFAASALPRALQLASLRAAVRDGGRARVPVGPAPVIGKSPAAAALRDAFCDVDAAFRGEWAQQLGSGGSVVSGASATSGLSYAPVAGGGSGSGGRNPGCTALAAVIAGGRLLVGNAGDCRAVLCRAGAPLALSRQHTADLDDERARVLAAGGSVARGAGGWRVGAAGLQVTRALGDFDLKGPIDGGVTPEPEVVELALTEEDSFLVMATDGVWDVMTDAEAVALVRDTVKDPQMSAKRLVTEALSRGSRDNCTALVVFLRPVGSLESVWTRASGVPAPEAAATFFGSRRAMPALAEDEGPSADEIMETF
ncbi:hypothetical protein Rsub_01428 [Raphidocelis subcapitata]|uniref:Uncharacterized protein n=1 Tax=Raphidocelis subcapitata TaxID=307507 RepID=A0A2V0NNV6_9CHLO|nr:hypothetical protein Rsub_01428 [Raphidocelis subcapitata]|eukprot:GBF88929.1 hypothetical protein Rsub_01428 [Raphidocelis subcapitata]